MRRSTCIGLLAGAAAVVTGCQSSTVRSERRDTYVASVTTEQPESDGKWVIVPDSQDPAARQVVRQSSASDERPVLNRPEMPMHEHALRAEGVPASIREAAAAEAPGRIESAGHYVTSDVDVFVLRIRAVDGLRELHVRQDGVVLVNRLNPAEDHTALAANSTDR
jgi:hypothetical protein